MGETWKDVRDFPGYQVSNEGRVRTHEKITSNARYDTRHWKDRIMKQKRDKRIGYRVHLWKDGKPYDVLVHRLVADAFVSPLMYTNLTVNHKDGDRMNNRAENLEWMTREDNIRYGFETGQYTVQTGCVLISETGERLTFRSICAASRYLGRSPGYVSNKKLRGVNAIASDGRKYSIEDISHE